MFFIQLNSLENLDFTIIGEKLKRKIRKKFIKWIRKESF